MTNVFLYGSSGTGKTILGAEIVKIKLSQLMTYNKPVREGFNQLMTSSINPARVLNQTLMEKFINLY